MKSWPLVLVGFCMWILPSIAQSQTVVNPKILEWTAPDHAITSKYEVGYFLGSATDPFQTVDIPVSAVIAGTGIYTTGLPRPALGNFTAKLKACGTAAGGGAICSDWSNATGPFVLNPAAPTGFNAR